ncbi:MAG: hypothetical protein WC455_20295 [Dehalococcoidia bacterium]
MNEADVMKRAGGRVYALCFITMLLFLCTAGAASEASDVLGGDAVSFSSKAGTWTGQEVFAWLSFVLGVALIMLLVYHLWCSQQIQKLYVQKVCALAEVMTKTNDALDRNSSAMEWCKLNSKLPRGTP